MRREAGSISRELDGHLLHRGEVGACVLCGAMYVAAVARELEPAERLRRVQSGARARGWRQRRFRAVGGCGRAPDAVKNLVMLLAECLLEKRMMSPVFTWEPRS